MPQGYCKGHGGRAMPAYRSSARLLAGLAMVAGVVGHARAQDLGKLFEKAARGQLRQVLTPPPGGRARAGPRGYESGTSASASSPEPHVIKTRDGWTLVALRYRAAGRPPSGAMPVILCHGLTYNALFWDLDPSCSL